jgi:predicted nucleotidyltransferase component of viral defense system
MMKQIKDKTASIKAKLLNLSKSQQVDFDALLLRFMQERFLHRLKMSEFSENFILKGGLLLICFQTPLSRPTKDIDFLGKGIGNTTGVLENAFKSIAGLSYDDGIEFSPSSISSERIVENNDYEGIRIKLDASLGKAVKKMQFDIAFGDAVWPAPNRVEFPTLLGSDGFAIYVYPIESVIAEKFEIMLKLETVNSRMKDFFDIYSFSRAFNLEGCSLKKAIEGTLKQRQTRLHQIPVIFKEEFINDKDKQRQWAAFLRKIRLEKVDWLFNIIMKQISNFLKPVTISIINKQEMPGTWNAEKGIWK